MKKEENLSPLDLNKWGFNLFPQSHNFTKIYKSFVVQ